MAVARSTDPNAFERSTELQQAAALSLRFLAQWTRPMPCKKRDTSFRSHRRCNLNTWPNDIGYINTGRAGDQNWIWDSLGFPIRKTNLHVSCIGEILQRRPGTLWLSKTNGLSPPKALPPNLKHGRMKAVSNRSSFRGGFKPILLCVVDTPLHWQEKRVPTSHPKILIVPSTDR